MTDENKNHHQKEIQRHLDEIEHHLSAVREALFRGSIDVGGLVSSPRDFDGQIIEGVFDGEAMMGADGKGYVVSPNYASKSQLVAGDKMKLSIKSDGTFVYKQIGPVTRRRLVATLDKTGNQYFAVAGKKKYRVLLASVTYFKAKVGSRVAILVPKSDASSGWAAIEHLVGEE